MRRSGSAPAFESMNVQHNRRFEDLVRLQLSRTPSSSESVMNDRGGPNSPPFLNTSWDDLSSSAESLQTSQEGQRNVDSTPDRNPNVMRHVRRSIGDIAAGDHGSGLQFSIQIDASPLQAFHALRRASNRAVSPRNVLDVADGTERVPNADGSNNETHSNNEGLPSQRGGTPSEGRLEATGLEVLDTSMELQVVARWLESALPFFVLLLGLFFFRHRVGIVLSLWYGSVLFHVNQILKKQMAMGPQRQPFILCGLVLLVMVQIASTYITFQPQMLWRQLLLLPPQQYNDVWNTFWIVVMNDLMVRFAIVVLKSALFMAYPKIIGNAAKKGEVRAFQVIDSLSSLYRCVLPLPVWVSYFLEEDLWFILSCLAAGFYVTLKLTQLVDRFHVAYVHSKMFFLKKMPYGSYASTEEVVEMGGVCSICQEDMTQSALKLHCGHIYCIGCISEWFEREHTCPLCRLVVQHTGLARHNDSLALQLF